MRRGLRSVQHGWNKHGQIITVIVAGASAVMAVYECYKATKKVAKIDEAKEEQLELIDEKLKIEEIDQKEYEAQRKKKLSQKQEKFLAIRSMTSLFRR